MLYRYGLRVGTSLLMHGKMIPGLKKVIHPVGYWRVPEYRFVLQEGHFKAGDRVLDIGSPKLLALYLAQHAGVEVYATDVDDYFVAEYEAIRRYQHIPDERLHVQTEDGRKLSFPDNFFDHVYCISTVEHIPGTGDSDCVREMMRVLKPGGTALITTPFWPGGKVEYWDAGKVYWASHTEQMGNGQAFYQRRYSAEEVQERLIEPSGMKVRLLRF
ncbi:MAG: class I SAM-dependent methyltransferase, partial [Anaerolineae bacterium]|nr:class I SAM-dependent methyltransferase [Anaerolineae bacterium]